MRVVNADDIYVTVNTAVKSKVCHLRIHFFVRRIINDNGNLGLLFDLICKFNSKGGISTVVMKGFLAVQINVARRIRAVKLKEILIGFRKFLFA